MGEAIAAIAADASSSDPQDAPPVVKKEPPPESQAASKHRVRQYLEQKAGSLKSKEKLSTRAAAARV